MRDRGDEPWLRSLLAMAVISAALAIIRVFSLAKFFTLEFELCIFYFPTAILFFAWLYARKRGNEGR